MTTEARIADALRVVGLKLERAIEGGHRSNRIDADDLLETLMAIADELDPVLPTFGVDRATPDPEG